MTLTDIRAIWLRCQTSCAHFVETYVELYNATAQAWLNFRLWPAQHDVLKAFATHRLLVLLKARQLGMTWLVLAYALWVITFQAPAIVLLFSLREAEAVELLMRLRGMYDRLPSFLRARGVTQSTPNTWTLSTGSRVLAFSTKGGRSYTASLAIVDEADYVPDLAQFLNGVKPTIDAGGKLFLISTSDKKTPTSTFKNLYRAAVQGIGDYHPIFLPWYTNPSRDRAWYARTKAEMFAQRGTDDDFYAEYPETPEEALAPETLDRRFPWAWIKAVFVEAPSIKEDTPPLPGLVVYAKPIPGHHYVIGADPAEGNPNSDDSAACVLDAFDWSQVAVMAGHVEPTQFAYNLAGLSAYYHDAAVLVERNNHGHAVIRQLAETEAPQLTGFDDHPGWLSNIRGKPLLMDLAAQALRDAAVTLTDSETANQLATIEASTLRAAGGLHDDRAIAFALAVAALAYHNAHATPSTAIAPPDPLTGIDQKDWQT